MRIPKFVLLYTYLHTFLHTYLHTCLHTHTCSCIFACRLLRIEDVEYMKAVDDWTCMVCHAGKRSQDIQMHNRYMNDTSKFKPRQSLSLNNRKTYKKKTKTKAIDNDDDIDDDDDDDGSIVASSDMSEDSSTEDDSDEADETSSSDGNSADESLSSIDTNPRKVTSRNMFGNFDTRLSSMSNCHFLHSCYH